MEWFSQLRPSSVNSFEQLVTLFLKQYSIFIEHTASEADLWRLAQGPSESLRSYLTRFKEIKSKIANPNNELALEALKNGLRYRSEYRRDLTVNSSASLEDALHRGLKFAMAEEEDLAMAPQQGYNSQNQGKKPYRRDGREQGQGLHSYAVEGQQSGRNDSFDPNKFCKHHNKVGHNTEECRWIRNILARKYANGELDGIDLSDEESRGRPAAPTASHKRERTPEEGRPGSPPPATKKRIDLVLSELDLNKDNRRRGPGKIHRPFFCCAQDALSPVKRVDFIMGGSSLCRDSVNSIKASIKRAEPNSRRDRPMTGPNTAITFWEKDAQSLDRPHDDALVVRLDVGGCELSRIMIDTGSSVDLIFYSALKQLDVDDYEIKRTPAPLTGFAGNTTLSIGTVELAVIAAGERRVVNFVIIDKAAPFNAILGRPWVYSMKAVPSTYHLCLKFPSEGTTKTIWGSQRQARECYMASHQLAAESSQ